MPEKWRLLLAGRDDNIGAGLKIKADQFGLTKNISFLDCGPIFPCCSPQAMSACE
jgi:hypothetical protein